MTQKFWGGLALLLIILGSAYTMGWYYIAGLIDREAARFLQEQSAKGLHFDGLLSPAHGFPGVFQLTYSGRIEAPDGSVTLPRLDISGLPFQGQPVTVTAPQGLVADLKDLPDYFRALDYAVLTFIIPKNLPPDASYARLKIWQTEGDARLEVPSLTLRWPDASLYAEISLTLTPDLQPEGTAMLGLTNHNFFVSVLADHMGLPDKNKLLILTTLNALNKENGAVVLPFRIQDQALYLKILRLGSLPAILWPGTPFLGRERPDIPPAPPQ
ncbi:MAG: DUF2125 domain-containing protein [Rhodospirillales bacterium]|nr:DUF2125 domain-containing protein [Rhodospirillales bacterium]MCB9973587.1 DUF2125 domain-containing protein [Rhodospirillales bacterium]MCB9979609.1 DUF2125 domain-containing protein [Rhodospirillales bacterium]